MSDTDQEQTEPQADSTTLTPLETPEAVGAPRPESDARMEELLKNFQVLLKTREIHYPVAFRIVGETFREPDSGVGRPFFGLSKGQFFSLFFAAAGEACMPPLHAAAASVIPAPAPAVTQPDSAPVARAISSPAHAASGPHASGQMRPLPSALAPMAAGSEPGTDRIEPSSASSPTGA